jgi:phosphoribosylanthranilate isomerase
MNELELGVKICGVTVAADAELAVALGARAIGLNFHPPSPRFITPRRAAAIAEKVRGRALVFGVFVGRTAEEIAAIDAIVGLDRIQLHGDESPAEVERWGERAVKVFRVGRQPPDLARDPRRQAAPRPAPAGLPVPAFPFAAYPGVAGFLFDVYREEIFGGSGEAWTWGSLAGLTVPQPYFVAGGIRPENARRALATSGAAGLDVCSGIESAPGRKDPRLLELLMKEVLHAG